MDSMKLDIAKILHMKAYARVNRGSENYRDQVIGELLEQALEWLECATAVNVIATGRDEDVFAFAFGHSLEESAEYFKEKYDFDMPETMGEAWQRLKDTAEALGQYDPEAWRGSRFEFVRRFLDDPSALNVLENLEYEHAVWEKASLAEIIEERDRLRAQLAEAQEAPCPFYKEHTGWSNYYRDWTTAEGCQLGGDALVCRGNTENCTVDDAWLEGHKQGMKTLRVKMSIALRDAMNSAWHGLSLTKSSSKVSRESVRLWLKEIEKRVRDA